MKKYIDEIRSLNQLQYSVTQEKGTERPFDNTYNDEYRDGIYVDIVSKEVLFCSKDKFDSGSGWPSFTKPVNENSIEKKRDFSHGMIRTEVKSVEANTHLGHVFDDGPNNNLRYCINSSSLLFITKEKMEENGYGDYLYLFNN
ncbi:peptide-methionine (R)-S-oxide reductase MsrB [Mycoplasmatota bacterium WC30]